MTKAKMSPLQGVVWPVEPFFVAALPLPPSVNGSYKTNHSAQFFSSSEKKQFEHDANFVLATGLYDRGTIEAIQNNKDSIPLTVTLCVYFKTLWKRDIDGVIKSIQDVCFKKLELNDNRVVRLNVEKYADKDNPRCEISISVCLDRIGK